MWGHRIQFAPRWYPCRTIPTRVGTSAACRRPTVTSSDHPHACGDIALALGDRDDLGGPSPRVWGHPRTGHRGVVLGRSIPTRVGTSPADCLTHRPTTVHPHACGDIACLDKQGDVIPGPSPRVWGHRGHAGARARRHRSIPTRVGTSLDFQAFFTPSLRFLSRTPSRRADENSRRQQREASDRPVGDSPRPKLAGGEIHGAIEERIGALAEALHLDDLSSRLAAGESVEVKQCLFTGGKHPLRDR